MLQAACTTLEALEVTGESSMARVSFGCGPLQMLARLFRVSDVIDIGPQGGPGPPAYKKKQCRLRFLSLSSSEALPQLEPAWGLPAIEPLRLLRPPTQAPYSLPSVRLQGVGVYIEVLEAGNGPLQTQLIAHAGKQPAHQVTCSSAFA